jgi:gliding motility-associated-like protein
MKKNTLLLVLTLLFTCLFAPLKTKASHLAGGEIFYEHLAGNSYRLYVFIYRDAYGATMPSSIDLCITSSCYATRSVILNQAPDPISGNPSGSPVEDLNECASPPVGATGGVNYELYVYSGIITLEGLCADWRFSYSLSARNSAIMNITGLSNLYLEAKLNNELGPNTSPSFVLPAVKRWCTVDPADPNSKPVVWSQAGTEPNGDSIVYRLTNPQGRGSGLCGPGINYNYSAGYSFFNPITTHNGLSIDPRTGVLTFMPTRAEIVVLRIDINEYRFNTGRLRWELVGSCMRDIQVAISDICVNSIATGDKLAFPAGSGLGRDSVVPIDSLRNLLGAYAIEVSNNLDSSTTATDTFVEVQVLENYACNDAVITLPFVAPLLCASVHPTDFRIIGPDGIARPVQEVETNCLIDLTTKEVKLKLYKSFDVNGVYALYIKRGNDGNTLTNRCGFEIKKNVVYLINVDDCPVLEYSIENVTTVEDHHIRLDFDLNPSSYISSTFNQISVLRANNNENFYKVGEIKNKNARTFTDTNLTRYDVDHQVYQYLLQLYTNGNPRTPSNFVNSVVLKGDSLGGNNLSFSWNAHLNDTYGGNATYEFFEGTYDSLAGGWTWVSLQKTGTNLSYNYTVPENRSGQFWYKVEARDDSGLNAYVCESNYFSLGVPPTPPQDIPVVNYVPNIITPNGDHYNDRFYFEFLPIDGYRPYGALSLSIFNRWGKPVFQDDNFMARNNEESGWDGTDQQSGQKVADGVYFYVARFSDQASGKVKEMNGSVTVSGGGF